MTLTRPKNFDERAEGLDYSQPTYDLLYEFLKTAVPAARELWRKLETVDTTGDWEGAGVNFKLADAIAQLVITVANDDDQTAGCLIEGIGMHVWARYGWPIYSNDDDEHVPVNATLH